jgi:hypothetical protein
MKNLTKSRHSKVTGPLSDVVDFAMPNKATKKKAVERAGSNIILKRFIFCMFAIL